MKRERQEELKVKTNLFLRYICRQFFSLLFFFLSFLLRSFIFDVFHVPTRRVFHATAKYRYTFSGFINLKKNQSNNKIRNGNLSRPLVVFLFLLSQPHHHSLTPNSISSSLLSSYFIPSYLSSFSLFLSIPNTKLSSFVKLLEK